MSDNQQERVSLIRERLTQAFEPIELEIIDDSAAHAGHEGAKQSGGGHFSINIIAKAFIDQSAVERHRLIYSALGDAMGTEIHALSINASAPEVTEQQDKI